MKGTPAFVFGRRGEQVVTEWLQNRGFFVVPCSLIDSGGAPMLAAAVRSHVLPDMLVSAGGVSYWIDVKTKRRATKNQRRNRWETGCEARQWRDYLAVQRETGIPGALAFVHVDDRQVLVGDLDTIGQDAATYPGPFPPGHAFTEPMVFFDINHFAWYSLEESRLFAELRASAAQPRNVRPWEVRPPAVRQAFLFDGDKF